MSIKKLHTKIGGFTIIEVMIVLAIAGTILGIVFLAVPTLQRNSRNTQRNGDAYKILTAVNECMTNNNGSISACLSANDTATAPSTYGTTTPVLAAPPNGNLDLSKLQILTTINLNIYSNTTAAAPTGTETAAVYAGNVCAGNSASTTNAGANNFVVLFNRETGGNGSTPACISP